MRSNRYVHAAMVTCAMGSLPAAADDADREVTLAVTKVDDAPAGSSELAATLGDATSYERCFAKERRDLKVAVKVSLRETGEPGAITVGGSPPRRVKTCLQRVIRSQKVSPQHLRRSFAFTLTFGQRVARVLAIVGEDEEPLGITAGGGAPRAQLPTAADTSPPTVTVATGTLLSGPDVVEAVLAKIRETYVPGLKRCYRESIVRVGERAVDAEITFELNATGRILGGTVTGLDDEAFAACIASRSDGWRSKAPSEAAKLRVRLHFDPK